METADKTDQGSSNAIPQSKLRYHVLRCERQHTLFVHANIPPYRNPRLHHIRHPPWRSRHVYLPHRNARPRRQIYALEQVMSRRPHTRWPHDASRQSPRRNQEALQEGAQGRHNPCIQQSMPIGGGLSIWALSLVYKDQDYSSRVRSFRLRWGIGMMVRRGLRTCAIGHFRGRLMIVSLPLAFDDVVRCFCLSAYVAVLYVIRRRSARRSEVG